MLPPSPPAMARAARFLAALAALLAAAAATGGDAGPSKIGAGRTRWGAELGRAAREKGRSAGSCGVGDGEGSWAMEGYPGEELGGEEARDCDWARKGTAAGKVLLRRVAWACVEAIWGGKRLGQDWPVISPKDSEIVSMCHGPGSLSRAP